MIDPGLLHPRERAIRSQTLDGRNRRALSGRNRKGAGPNRSSIQVNGARTARGNAAPKLGARQADRFTYDPEQRGVRIHIERMGLLIHRKTDYHLKAPPRSPDRSALTTVPDS